MSKNYKGGYKLIDLQKNDFEDGGNPIKGIYHSIEASYTKVLLLTGIVIGGVEKNDVYVEELKVVDGSFHLKAYGYDIIVDDDDAVTFQEIPQPTKKDVSLRESVTYMNLSDGDEVTYHNVAESQIALKINKNDGLRVFLTNGVTENNNITAINTNSYNSDPLIILFEDATIYVKRIGDFVFITSDIDFTNEL